MVSSEIEKYLPLVRSIAQKIYWKLPSFIKFEDLISAGALGLVQAVNRFDPSKTKNAEKYFEIRIRGAILDELRSMDLISRNLRKKITEVKDLVNNLEKKFKRKVLDEEVADKLGLDLDSYAQLMKILHPVIVIKFDDLKIFKEDDKKDVLQYIKDPKGIDPSKALLYKKIMNCVVDCIKRLKKNERLVTRFYYYEELNFKEIGKILSLTESRICQIHSSAIINIKECLKKRDIEASDFEDAK